MKTIEEIYAQMLARFQAETGVETTGSSDLAVRFYAVAAQIYGLYVQGEWITRQCFPQSAQGEYLDLHAQLRGIERRGASTAQGVIRFLSDGPAPAALTIPAGTVCMTAGLVRFETTEEGLLEEGSSTVDVPARALEPGESGNAAAGSILTMAVAPVGISGCVNPEAFSGGADAEEDEVLRQRVLETYRRMPNGANAAFYQQEALSFPQVAAAAVIPRSRGVGTVDVVVSTAQGTPGEDLLETLRAHFAQRREIAVEVEVRGPELETVDVSVAVAPAEGYTLQAAQEAARNAIRAWFDGTRLGQSVLRAKLTELAFSPQAVGNCTVLSPAADVMARADTLPQLGNLSITEMEGDA